MDDYRDIRPERKYCDGCKKEKPSDLFYTEKRKNRKTIHLSALCKECKKKQQQSIRQTEEHKEYSSSYEKNRPRNKKGTPEYEESLRKRTEETILVNGRCYSIKKKYRIKSSYGLTLEEYDKLVFVDGSGVCFICSSTFTDENKPHIDHCHETGKVISALCSKCNTGLGLFYENPDLLESATKYAKEYKKPKKRN